MSKGVSWRVRYDFVPFGLESKGQEREECGCLSDLEVASVVQCTNFQFVVSDASATRTTDVVVIFSIRQP